MIQWNKAALIDDVCKSVLHTPASINNEQSMVLTTGDRLLTIRYETRTPGIDLALPHEIGSLHHKWYEALSLSGDILSSTHWCCILCSIARVARLMGVFSVDCAKSVSLLFRGDYRERLV